ncbi:heme exporter protein CcmD [Microbulbifer agarilyticus]|uniref:heme exporter protein CcmD n=1 Tax=Microbulbifer agarilyticus TaxID=260552 RepID=UPI001CD351AE|nr:heme exporter protein CcmD [Microbulbifer agarilyticus]MCA0901277.1 heme exporter protein CcmD [Microbulbifer agarilyticus]
MQFQFDSLASFFAMDGHGPYVWASYGMVVLVLVVLAVTPVFRQRKLRRELQQQLRQEEARRRAATTRAASQRAAEVVE